MQFLFIDFSFFIALNLFSTIINLCLQDRNINIMNSGILADMTNNFSHLFALFTFAIKIVYYIIPQNN